MSTQIIRLAIPDLCCATEERLVRGALARVPGVRELDFDLLGQQVTVTHDLADPAPIRAAIASTGLRVMPLDGGAGDERFAASAVRCAPDGASGMAERGTGAAPTTRPRWLGHPHPWLPLALSGLLALSAELAALLPGGEDSLAVMALALAAMALAGRDVARKALGSLRARTLNINLLMAIAVVGAVLIGHWPEAAMVTFLFALAEKIEGRALDRARDAMRELMTLAPDEALVQSGDGDWRWVPVQEVRVGQTLRVRPGDRVPLDGTVKEGASTVNQAPITGESLPLAKAPGDPLYAGTINVEGSLAMTVTAAAGDTTLDKIGRTLQRAQAQRAPTERFVDRFARVYTPVVVVVAALAAVLPPLLFGVPVEDAVYTALVLLVIACPCALVLSTPVTVVSALTAAARNGVLVKGGTYLEAARELRVVALDKTGTLTHGQPQVTDVVPLNGEDPDTVLRLAASLNVHADHPVARAIVAAWRANGGSPRPDSELLPVSDVTLVVGRGVEGRLDGRRLLVGNHRLAQERNACSAAAEAALAVLEADGKTTVVLATDGGPIAALGVADTVRGSSAAAIAALHGLGLRTVLLTGDNDATARAIARQLGIDDVRSQLLPEDKLAAVAGLARDYGAVGMVGDGVNDAPALARATVGFAMGAAGSDTALETADVAFMNDDLRKLPWFLTLSRRATRILAQNIALAIAFKVVFFALTFAGVATLWMAVFADMGTSLLVVANGLRLLRSRA